MSYPEDPDRPDDSWLEMAYEDRFHVDDDPEDLYLIEMFDLSDDEYFD